MSIVWVAAAGVVDVYTATGGVGGVFAAATGAVFGGEGGVGAGFGAGFLSIQPVK